MLLQGIKPIICNVWIIAGESALKYKFHIYGGLLATLNIISVDQCGSISHGVSLHMVAATIPSFSGGSGGGSFPYHMKMKYLSQ